MGGVHLISAADSLIAFGSSLAADAPPVRRHRTTDGGRRAQLESIELEHGSCLKSHPGWWRMRELVRSGVESCAPPACGMRADHRGSRSRAQSWHTEVATSDGVIVGSPPGSIRVVLAREERKERHLYGAPGRRIPWSRSGASEASSGV